MMTDVREPGEMDEADRLPWLEAVEEDDEESGPSAGKLIAFLIVALGVIGLVVGGGVWLANRGADEGEGGLIAAPEGDYKVAPDEPGGMEVEGEGDTAFAASEGGDPRGSLDTSAVPEAPVTPPARTAEAQAPATGAPQQRPAPSATPPAASAPARTGAGGTIQLGAFSSQAAANAAWRALSGRFTYLAPLTHSVSPTESGGRTLYRLRASGEGAADICNRLRVAGETCLPIG